MQEGKIDLSRLKSVTLYVRHIGLLQRKTFFCVEEKATFLISNFRIFFNDVIIL